MSLKDNKLAFSRQYRVYLGLKCDEEITKTMFYNHSNAVKAVGLNHAISSKYYNCYSCSIRDYILIWM